MTYKPRVSALLAPTLHFLHNSIAIKATQQEVVKMFLYLSQILRKNSKSNMRKN